MNALTELNCIYSNTIGAKYSPYFCTLDSERLSSFVVMSLLKEHGVESVEQLAEFFGEFGESESYRTEDILAWLGY